MRRRRILSLAIACVLALCCTSAGGRARHRWQALAAPEPETANPAVSVRLGIAPPWRINVSRDARLDDRPLTPGTYEVSWQGTVLMRTECGEAVADSAVGLHLCSDVPITLNGRHYRGDFHFRRNSVVNTLTLQDYLRGVVGREIGGHAEFEALKAQAVVARTYTLAHIQSEVADDTSFQMYRGVDAETDAVNRAVDATLGQVLTWQGRLARQVCYHSTCGGHTEDNENVFLTAPVPYLRGVACVVPAPGADAPLAAAAAAEIPSAAPSPLPLVEDVSAGAAAPLSSAAAQPSTSALVDGGDSVTDCGLGGPSATPAPPPTSVGEPACENSTYFRWTVLWPVEGLPDIAILRTSENGRVVAVRVGERVVQGDEIRRALCFRDTSGRACPLHSNFFTLHREANVMRVEGHGWGHGVGMCQWGARGMAKAGLGYEAILRHYFPGTELTTLSL